MPVVEVDDRRLLPVLQPAFAGDVSVVLVDLLIAVLPRVILARPEFEPGQQRLGGRLGAVCLIADLVHDLIPHGMGNRLAGFAAYRCTLAQEECQGKFLQE
ncbi:MAG: hypothetical protein DWH91_14135 [Planctomycetota bacterium]|nr:MAG: hypothetical protein DWH91_14135 [Planctomycetota bacterium]